MKTGIFDPWRQAVPEPIKVPEAKPDLVEEKVAHPVCVNFKGRKGGLHVWLPQEPAQHEATDVAIACIVDAVHTIYSVLPTAFNDASISLVDPKDPDHTVALQNGPKAVYIATLATEAAKYTAAVDNLSQWFRLLRNNPVITKLLEARGIHPFAI